MIRINYCDEWWATNPYISLHSLSLQSLLSRRLGETLTQVDDLKDWMSKTETKLGVQQPISEQIKPLETQLHRHNVSRQRYYNQSLPMYSQTCFSDIERPPPIQTTLLVSLRWSFCTGFTVVVVSEWPFVCGKCGWWTALSEREKSTSNGLIQQPKKGIK